MQDNQNKLASLEITRFFCALAVILWHYQYYFFVPGSLSARQLLPFYEALSIFYNAGYYAVDWFWVLSGYVFFMKYRVVLAVGKMSASGFFGRRFSRLYPLHLLTLLLVIALQVLFLSAFGAKYWMYDEQYGANFDVPDFVAQLFMASNWFTTQYTFNGPIWSVSIEIMIYLLFFIATKHLALRGVIMAGLVAAFSLTAYQLVKPLQYGTFEWLFECLACFYFGGLVWEIRENAAHRYADWAGAAFDLAAGGLILVTVFACYEIDPATTLAFILPALAVLWLVHSTLVVRSTLLARVSHLGNLTYASYLLHFPVALLLVIVLKLLHVDLAVAFLTGVVLA
jgi:peptidoglycan/LPS O-acetylase OafA/YrhL